MKDIQDLGEKSSDVVLPDLYQESQIRIFS